MKIIYFSLDYSPHDHRFLAALAETEHEVHYVRLQRGSRQVEDRPVPEKIQQVLWAGGQGLFRWCDVPQLAFDFRCLTKEIKPDLVHAGPIQTCAFIAALSGFHPLLTMSWGFDLMEDVERNAWWRMVTQYVLRNSDYFTSDAQVTRDNAVVYGMDPDKTVVFPWGVDLQHFSPKHWPQPLLGTALRGGCPRQGLCPGLAEQARAWSDAVGRRLTGCGVTSSFRARRGQ
jgi:hypothetical protein